MHRVHLACILVTLTLFGLSIGETSAQRAQYRPETTDMNGNPITSIEPGGSFQFQMFVQDVRSEPQGVFAAYVNVVFDESLFATTGAIEHSNQYSAGDEGTLLPGRMDGVGGVDGIAPLGGDEFLLFSVPMVALDSVGTGIFETNEPEDQVFLATLLFGDSEETNVSDIAFRSTSLTVVPEPGVGCLSLLAFFGMLLRGRRRKE